MPDRPTPQHHPAALRGLKVAFGQLVKDVGGAEAANAVTGYPAPRFSEAASLHNLDRWPRVDIVAELEAIAPRPLVTATMARLAGCSLLPLAPAGATTAAILASLETAGRFVTGAAAAMADGQVSDAERARLAELLGALRQAASRAEAALAGPTLPLRRVG